MAERIRIGALTDPMDGGPGPRTMAEVFLDAMRAVERYELDGPEPGPSEVREFLHRLAGVARAVPAVAERLEAGVRGLHEAGELRRPEGAPVAASVSSLEGALVGAAVSARDLAEALKQAGSSIADVELIDEW